MECGHLETFQTRAPHILDLIFGDLDDVSLSQLRLVSRYWNDVVPSWQKERLFRHWSKNQLVKSETCCTIGIDRFSVLGLRYYYLIFQFWAEPKLPFLQACQ